MKKLKEVIFHFKKGVESLFIYPKKHIKIMPIYDDYWKSKRGKSIGALSSWQKERADLILKNVQENKEISILDIGCGDGSILNYLKSNLKYLNKLYGIDFSDFSLNQARKFNIVTFKKDISKLDNLDFLSEDIDYILLLEVIEHVQNSEKLVDIAFKKAKKGVFVSVPNTGYFLHRLRLLFGRFPLQWREHPSEHVRFWTVYDMNWWLSALDYKNYELYLYKGVNLLNKIFPSIFGAGMLIFIKKDDEYNNS